MRWVSCDYFNFSSITLYGLQGWWGEQAGRDLVQGCFREWGAKGTVKQPFPNRVNHTVACLWSPPAGVRAGAKAPRPTYRADLLLGCFLLTLISASLSLDSSPTPQLY